MEWTPNLNPFLIFQFTYNMFKSITIVNDIHKGLQYRVYHEHGVLEILLSEK